MVVAVVEALVLVKMTGLVLHGGGGGGVGGRGGVGVGGGSGSGGGRVWLVKQH